MSLENIYKEAATISHQAGLSAVYQKGRDDAISDLKTEKPEEVYTVETATVTNNDPGDEAVVVEPTP